MKQEPRKTFSLKQLLLAVTVVAVPFALALRYWTNVTNTVHGMPIPISDAGIANQLLLALLVASVLAIAGYFCFQLIFKKRYAAFAIVALFACVASPFVWNWFHSTVVDPPRGWDVAELHNEACAITAIAVERFVKANKSWPGSWAELAPHVDEILAEIETERSRQFSIYDLFSTAERPRGVLARLPDPQRLKSDLLPTLVDVDFDADMNELAGQNWRNFTGIKPHMPTYNNYGLEFDSLIGSMPEK